MKAENTQSYWHGLHSESSNANKFTLTELFKVSQQWLLARLWLHLLLLSSVMMRMPAWEESAVKKDEYSYARCICFYCSHACILPILPTVLTLSQRHKLIGFQETFKWQLQYSSSWSQRMNPTDFSNCLTFLLVPAGQSFHSYCEISQHQMDGLP